MSGPGAASFYDPSRSDEPVQARRVRLEGASVAPPRTNYFALYRIESGEGTFWADAGEHDYRADALLCLTPYQRVLFAPRAAGEATLIQFHANFLCVETFHAETGCGGVLFNDPYGKPFVALDDRAKVDADELIARILRERADNAMARDEVILASLKVLLIVASRLKAAGAEARAVGAGVADGHRHPLLGRLRDLIEENYQTPLGPSDYARLLNVSPKTLGRLTRAHLGKTLTDLIRDRVLIHAKWQLLHTLRPVKEIAAEVGFQDELYFSRVFKKATGVSPTFFREFETEIRGGSNLSMLSAGRSIQADEPARR